jgi:hypothetical protein
MKKKYALVVIVFVIISSLMIKTDFNLDIIKAEITDQYPPQISAVSANPQIVGFGYNVTISPTVIDNLSGVQLVRVNITYPDGAYGNYSMTKKQGSTYEFIFSDTWQHGRYNYSIWANDNISNANITSQHSFNVTVYSTITIATLKDKYTDNEYINITDPPNPTETLMLINRGLTWDEYYNADTGQNTLAVSTGPINYKESNGTWMPINNSFNQVSSGHPAYNYGYRIGNDRGFFGVYFKPNIQNDWPVAFTYNRSDNPSINVIRSKLVGVGYVDPASNWAYQYLQTVQSSQGQTSGNSITYNDVFTGTDVTWSYGNTELKEEITLSNATKTILQNHPPSQYGLHNASSYLVFITKLDYQNLILFNASGMLTGNVTVSDVGIGFKDMLGRFKCALPLGEAYEMNNESARKKLIYRIVHLNGNTYLLSGLKISDLNAMTFPVIIDPTLTVNVSKSDGYLYKFDSNYKSVWTASDGTVSNDDSYILIGQINTTSDPPSYYIYRGFLQFDTSELPTNACINNATLSLFKKDNYSATDFTITVQNGQPTYPNDSLEEGDYDKEHYSGNGGGLGTVNFINGRNNITLTDLGWINVGGITKLCLRSSRDIEGTEPTGQEYVNLYSADIEEEANPDPRPTLIVTYQNQSKIKNTGTTNIKGYLHIQIQYYNESSWYVANDVIDETSPRTITAGNQLALDTVFNGLMNTTDIPFGNGLYRVYAAFRDSKGNPLVCNNNQDLVGSYEFHLSRPCHGWRKLLLQDGFWKGHIYGYWNGEALTSSNVATRGMAIYNGELYVGTENLNKSKWITQWFNGFAAGTQITMAGGSYQNIEDIQSGDTVKAYNMDTHEYVNATVQVVYQHASEESPGYTLKINGNLSSSPNQVFLVNGVLKEARDIVTGDNLTNKQGTNTTITSIDNITNLGTDSIYNFMIGVSPYDDLLQPNNLTFFANGIEAYPWSTEGTDILSYEAEAGVDLVNDIPTWGPEGVFKTRAKASDGCEIWKYDQSQAKWIPVINGTGTTHTSSGFGGMTNWGAGEIKEFHGYFFVGTWSSPENGCEVWRYDGTTWTEVVTGGFSSFVGDGSVHNCCVTSMLEFKNHLYVGTMNWDSSDDGFCQVWRTKNYDGSEWEQVVNKGFRDLPGAGPSAGSSAQNAYAWRMANFSGMLYVGTMNNLNILQTGERGCELFRSSTGNANDWHKLALPNSDGFGEKNNYGIRGLVTWKDQNGQDQYLYVGVAANFLQRNRLINPECYIDATEIWRFDNSSPDPNHNPSPWLCIVGSATGAEPWEPTYDGFGDHYNKYPWSMARCGNTLWVGTLNTQLLGSPSSEGCEIWNYDPLTSTLTPSVTSRYPAEKPSGFGELYHVATRSMIEFPAGSGQLVAGVVSLRGQYRVLWKEYGCEVWTYYP